MSTVLFLFLLLLFHAAAVGVCYGLYRARGNEGDLKFFLLLVIPLTFIGFVIYLARERKWQWKELMIQDGHFIALAGVACVLVPPMILPMFSFSLFGASSKTIEAELKAP